MQINAVHLSNIVLKVEEVLMRVCYVCSSYMCMRVSFHDTQNELLCVCESNMVMTTSN